MDCNGNGHGSDPAHSNGHSHPTHSETRCPGCHKLLMLGDEIKCPRCKEMVKLDPAILQHPVVKALVEELAELKSRLGLVH